MSFPEPLRPIPLRPCLFVFHRSPAAVSVPFKNVPVRVPSRSAGGNGPRGDRWTDIPAVEERDVALSVLLRCRYFLIIDSNFYKIALDKRLSGVYIRGHRRNSRRQKQQKKEKILCIARSVMKNVRSVPTV